MKMRIETVITEGLIKDLDKIAKEKNCSEFDIAHPEKNSIIENSGKYGTMKVSTLIHGDSTINDIIEYDFDDELVKSVFGLIVSVVVIVKSLVPLFKIQYGAIKSLVDSFIKEWFSDCKTRDISDSKTTDVGDSTVDRNSKKVNCNYNNTDGINTENVQNIVKLFRTLRIHGYRIIPALNNNNYSRAIKYSEKCINDLYSLLEESAGNFPAELTASIKCSITSMEKINASLEDNHIDELELHEMYKDYLDRVDNIISTFADALDNYHN